MTSSPELKKGNELNWEITGQVEDYYINHLKRERNVNEFANRIGLIYWKLPDFFGNMH